MRLDILNASIEGSVPPHWWLVCLGVIVAECRIQFVSDISILVHQSRSFRLWLLWTSKTAWLGNVSGDVDEPVKELTAAEGVGLETVHCAEEFVAEQGTE